MRTHDKKQLPRQISPHRIKLTQKEREGEIMRLVKQHPQKQLKKKRKRCGEWITNGWKPTLGEKKKGGQEKEQKKKESNA